MGLGLAYAHHGDGFREMSLTVNANITRLLDELQAGRTPRDLCQQMDEMVGLIGKMSEFIRGGTRPMLEMELATVRLQIENLQNLFRVFPRQLATCTPI